MTAKKPPAYRIRSTSASSRAVVTLTDSETGNRRDYYLGEPGSQESLAEYSRLLSEWQAAAGRLPGVDRRIQKNPSIGPTVAQIAAAYKSDQLIVSYRGMNDVTIKLLCQMYGKLAAADFGPNALRNTREAMVKGDPESGRKKWRRSVINGQTALIVKIFKWAVAHELLDESCWRRLTTLEPLNPKRTDVVPNRKIKPVPIQYVREIQAASNRQISAIIELQLLTGARVREILYLKPCNIDRSQKVWKAELETHKNAHRRKRRVLYFGPKAQDVLRPFLLRNPESYLFSPIEAEEDRLRKRNQNRKTLMCCGNTRGTNKVKFPKKKPQNHYTSDSYCRYIQRLCGKLDIPKWSPRQLRHNAASEIERMYDSVTASILLGHSDAKITEAVYIDREDKAAIDVVSQIG